MRTCAIVVGAGSGTRAGLRPPKQYQTLGSVPVFARTLNAFLNHPSIHQVTAVIAEAHEQLFRVSIVPHLTDAVLTVIGSDTRTHSVMAGLEPLRRSGVTHVVIHDAVRPFVSAALISRIVTALRTHDGAIPGIETADALWRADGETAVQPLKRDGVMRVQTPQGFALNALLDAYSKYGGSADDDAAVMVAAAFNVQIVDGQEDNVKLTREEDFERARRRLQPTPDIRTGSGFDVHRFGEGSGLILCGVRLPYERCLLGHSDADVASHAIADSIYGALAQGDIGCWFPPSDPRWKGADSMIFLTHAADIAARAGYAVTSLDCTIICEKPRIAPYAQAMRKKIADALHIDTSRVGIKATTSEGLGFTGRGEGIAAMSTATLCRD